MTINELVAKNHQAMKEKGFHEGEKNIGELLMLIVSELGEALDAHRSGRIYNSPKNSEQRKRIHDMYLKEYVSDSKVIITTDEFFTENIKDTFEDELADVVLRVTDLCGLLGIDLESHIKAKMRYNATRPYKHNKAY